MGLNHVQHLYGQPGATDAELREAAQREVGLVGVVGSGTMASGIAEVFAKGGHDVVLVARTDDRRSVSFVVNAKNRMGGYAGREKYFCRFDVKSGALLSVN